MPYIGSYVWKIRQKIGHDLLIIVASGAVIVNNEEKILLVYNKDMDAWTIPGGLGEIDKSWRELALTEVREEAGITARLDDLIPFATISGAGWTNEYKNGDKIRVFEIIFILREWQSEVDDLDDTEISEKRWFSLDEIEKYPLSRSTQLLIPAYQKWQKTGELQMIEVDK